MTGSSCVLQVVVNFTVLEILVCLYLRSSEQDSKEPIASSMRSAVGTPVQNGFTRLLSVLRSVLTFKCRILHVCLEFTWIRSFLIYLREQATHLYVEDRGNGRKMHSSNEI